MKIKKLTKNAKIAVLFYCILLGLAIFSMNYLPGEKSLLIIPPCIVILIAALHFNKKADDEENGKR